MESETRDARRRQLGQSAPLPRRSPRSSQRGTGAPQRWPEPEDDDEDDAYGAVRRSPQSRSQASGDGDGASRSRAATAAHGDERYRPGSRRTSAEPLRASWRPKGGAGSSQREGRERRGRLSRLARAYGWRVYALPVLLVLTVLVVIDTARSGPDPSAAQSPGAAAGGDAGAVTESRPAPVNLNIPTAELPAGGELTQKGAGKWHPVPGSGPKAGTGGRVKKYAIEVEDGIEPASFGGEQAFARMVEGTLSDPRSWTGSGQVSLQRVEPGENPDFTVDLTTPQTTKRPDLCGFTIPYETSCYNGGKEQVIINLARWVRGAKAWDWDMTGYRQYAVNHEVGHALGNKHVGCPQDGGPAPVMMQQSFGVSNNYVADLNKVDPSNYSAVPADGKTCKPAAWPFPQGNGR